MHNKIYDIFYDIQLLYDLLQNKIKSVSKWLRKCATLLQQVVINILGP